jgi:eukaryotic-like serine/threonine-protein kinase
MNSTKECPAKVELAEFMDGQLIGPDLEEIAEHLEHCAVCQEAVLTLAPSDTLVESLRGEATAAEKCSGEFPHSLLEKINQIPRLESISENSSGMLGAHKTAAVNSEGVPAPPLGELRKERSLGHYRLLEVLGSGGMGEVFKAEDTKLHRTVALKVMLPRIAADPSANARFLREARAAAGLVSDHIVTVYQVGEDDGLPFIATELLVGTSLEAALREGRKFSIAEILKIGREVAEGLSVAHANGIVHRDIKTANLWLEQSNKKSFRVKILDFGLARAELDESQLTHASAIIGTPAFMAPEQARGSKAIDFRSDLFSLGCVLYLLCAHELPFKADSTIETLMALALNSPKSPELIQPGTPHELAKLVMELLEKDPKNRPSSAEDVIARLVDLESQVANPESTQRKQKNEITTKIERATNAFRSGIKRPIAVALALFALAAASWASFSILFWQTPDGRIVRIECNDPAIQVAFGNGEMKITGAYSHPIILQPGKVELKIKKLDENGGEFIFESDKLIIKKGDAIALKIGFLDKEIKIEQLGTGIIDSKKIPVRSFDGPGLSADQRGALWVLSIGGSLRLKDLEWFHFEEELPAGDYQVAEINLATNLLVTDDGLKNLRGLTELTSLRLDSAKVTDAGLAHLKDLVKLSYLSLYGTQITDAGIVYLKNMTELTFLGLGGRLPITDSAVVQIRRFDKLKQLYLDNSKITDAALPLLRRLEQLELLDVGGTMVTDVGIDSVIYMESLNELVLHATKVTDRSMIGIGRMKNLEVLSFWKTSISDVGLDRLHKLTKLKQVYARSSQITKDGLARFHQAIPNCKIEHGIEDSPVPASGLRLPVE